MYMHRENLAKALGNYINITVLHILELTSETWLPVQEVVFEIVGCVVHMLCFSPLVLCFHYACADGEYL